MVDNSTVLYCGTVATVPTGLPEHLKRRGFRFLLTKPESGIDEFAELNPDLIVLGHSLDREAYLDCAYKMAIVKPSAPLLFLCNPSDLPDSYKLPFTGIHFAPSGLAAEQISVTIEQALRDNGGVGNRSDYPVIIGQSPAIAEVKEKIRSLSGYETTVLITGETGTGKELVARSLHYYSPRKNGPLIKITCGALPDDLLESEVFGFQKGAFTGAHRDKPGRLELAHEGTLFIDEIGNLSLPLQTKFLQIFESSVFARLGGVNDQPIDIRVVAATNSNLGEKMREGFFRRDLFYRLNLIHIEVPPLRDRPEDIECITRYFLHKYCFELNRNVPDFPSAVSSHLQAYHWPGNVRELENVIRRAITLRNWDFVFHELTPDSTVERKEIGPSEPENPEQVRYWDEVIREALKEKNFSLKKITKAYTLEAEKRTILEVLDRIHWNRKFAAQLLGVSYKTLLTRIEELGIKSVKSHSQLRFPSS